MDGISEFIRGNSDMIICTVMVFVPVVGYLGYAVWSMASGKGYI